METKVCLDCGEEKPLKEFFARPSRPRGQSYCKPCHQGRVKDWQRGNPKKVTDLQRAYRWKRYGLTPDQILEAQSITECEVCGSIKDLSVDHCHKNLKYRGVLCSACNRALGAIDDNVEIMYGLIAYLKERG